MNSLPYHDAKGDILLVSDELQNLRTLSAMLIEEGHMVRVAKDSATALKVINSQPPDIILLDIKLPDMDGYEVCKKLKADERYTDIPVLFISSLDETVDRIKGFEAGGVDYVTKPIQIEEALARVDSHIALSRLRRELEQRVEERTAELYESEGRYRSLVEASPSAIMAIQDGNIIFTNPAGAELLGFYDPEEMVGLSAMDLVSPESQQLVVERLKNLEMGERNPNAEIELVKRDGSKIIAESTSVSILLDGKPAGVIIARDITEIKQAEEALEERFRFQELVAGISTKFIGLSGVEFEQSIQDTLAEIGRYFEVDTVRLYRLSLQGDVLKIRNIWRTEHLAPKEEMPEIHKMKYPNLAAHYSQGEPVLFGSFNESPEWPEMRKILKFFGTKAGVGVPLEIDDSGVDVFAMDKVLSEHGWPKDIVEHSRAIGQVILSAMRRREAEVELQDSYDEIKRLKDRLEQENIYLREEIELNYRHDEIVGESDAIKQVLAQAEKVAEQDTCVLILGETGTGKELIAHAIHNLSPRRARPMIKVNCAALPATLIESELFGREKGAFTGALSKQIGRFEAADGSTIFLDEIGDLPLELQTKLLRVLQEGQFERLGSYQTVSVDIRIIAATNRDLGKAAKKGRFRRDLYFRLNVFPITVPSLRDRQEDIPLLTWAFIKEFGKSMGKNISTVKKKTMDLLTHYSWPGNVRELRNVIERAMILSAGSALHIDRIESEEALEPSSLMLEEVERNHITRVLESTRWRISGQKGAAQILGLKPTTLRSRMEKLGIYRPD
jgi:PAS domain S-box-containing protein